MKSQLFNLAKSRVWRWKQTAKVTKRNAWNWKAVEVGKEAASGGKEAKCKFLSSKEKCLWRPFHCSNCDGERKREGFLFLSSSVVSKIAGLLFAAETIVTGTYWSLCYAQIFSPFLQWTFLYLSLSVYIFCRVLQWLKTIFFVLKPPRKPLDACCVATSLPLLLTCFLIQLNFVLKIYLRNRLSLPLYSKSEKLLKFSIKVRYEA